MDFRLMATILRLTVIPMSESIHTSLSCCWTPKLGGGGEAWAAETGGGTGGGGQNPPNFWIGGF